MVENFAQRAHADDVARVYVGIVAVTSGRTSAVVEAALAMALTLIGERHGLTGPALLDWIETIAIAASIAAQRQTCDPELTVATVTPHDLLN
jgi:hypothetical protein